jgi:hypothetical protein
MMFRYCQYHDIEISMSEEDKSVPVMVRLPAAQADAIDEWRRAEKDIPSRPEAIRRLAEQSLEISRLRSRNATLRERFRIAYERADKSLQGQIDKIACKQSAVPSDDPLDGLVDGFENLRARALKLVEAGVAEIAAFPELEENGEGPGVRLRKGAK